MQEVVGHVVENKMYAGDNRTLVGSRKYAGVVGKYAGVVGHMQRVVGHVGVAGPMSGPPTCKLLFLVWVLAFVIYNIGMKIRREINVR